MAGASLLDHFSALDDPRQPGKVLYPLPEVMLLVLCATLADDVPCRGGWRLLAQMERPSHDLPPNYAPQAAPGASSRR